MNTERELQMLQCPASVLWRDPVTARERFCHIMIILQITLFHSKSNRYKCLNVYIQLLQLKDMPGSQDLEDWLCPSLCLWCSRMSLPVVKQRLQKFAEDYDSRAIRSRQGDTFLKMQHLVWVVVAESTFVNKNIRLLDQTWTPDS